MIYSLIALWSNSVCFFQSVHHSGRPGWFGLTSGKTRCSLAKSTQRSHLLPELLQKRCFAKENL